MTRWRGRLERRDLEGGAWILRTASGEHSLYGDVPPQLDGQQVEVEGDAEEAFGFAMAGPAIAVKAVRKA